MSVSVLRYCYYMIDAEHFVPKSLSIQIGIQERLAQHVSFRRRKPGILQQKCSAEYTSISTIYSIMSH